MEKCFYLITYTVDNCCGFWQCQDVISLPEIANTICGGTGRSCGHSAKPLRLHPTPRNAQAPAQPLKTHFNSVGFHGPPRACLAPSGERHHPPSGSRITSCNSSWLWPRLEWWQSLCLLMCSQNPVLPLPGGLQHLPMFCGFCFVSKVSVPGQRWGGGGVCCAGVKKRTFFILCDKKKIPKGRHAEIISSQ